MFERVIFLNPGELVFTKTPLKVKTILGSCVAVCIFDTKNRYGGMCHYLLPNIANQESSTKYGNVALPLLLKKFIDNQCEKKNLIASIVGGSFILFNKNEIFFVGDRNIELAKSFLLKNHIQIDQINVGGEKGRTITFNTHTGHLAIKIHRKFEDDYI